MGIWFDFVSWALDQYQKVLIRLRAFSFFLIRGTRLKKIGRGCKIKGGNRIAFGKGICIGDYCWIEAIYKYQGKVYKPKLDIGDNVAISDLSHISCADQISIGKDCLIGSKVYIGDHNHGTTKNYNELITTPPALRHLGDMAQIVIGEKCWICDGAVILAGTNLAPGSIVGANSVVHLIEKRPALIAGMPAKVIRYFDL